MVCSLPISTFSWIFVANVGPNIPYIGPIGTKMICFVWGLIFTQFGEPTCVVVISTICVDLRNIHIYIYMYTYIYIYICRSSYSNPQCRSVYYPSLPTTFVRTGCLYLQRPPKPQPFPPKTQPQKVSRELTSYPTFHGKVGNPHRLKSDGWLVGDMWSFPGGNCGWFWKSTGSSSISSWWVGGSSQDFDKWLITMVIVFVP